MPTDAGRWTTEALSRLFARNWTLKLVSFGLAVMLWVVVRVESPSTRPIAEVPVQVEVADPAWVLAGDPDPLQVQLEVSGSMGDLMALSAERPQVRVVLDNVAAADTAVRLTRDLVILPEGNAAVVDQVVPDRLVLRLDRLEAKMVELVVPTVGELDPSLALAAEPQAEPAQVRLRGASGRLESVRQVPLEPLDLTVLDRGGRFELAVDTSQFPGMEVLPRRVMVDLVLEPRIERRVLGLPLSAEPGWSVGAVQPILTVQGARSLVEALDPLDLTLSVRTTGEGTESEGMVVVRGLPDLLQASVEPDRVTVRRTGVASGGGS